MNDKQIEQLAEEAYPLPDKKDFMADRQLIYFQRHAFIAGYKSALEQSPWVSVEKGLPEVFKGGYSNRVLCITSSGLIRVGYILNGEWMMDSPAESFERYGYTVTHYQLITPPSNPTNHE